MISEVLIILFEVIGKPSADTYGNVRPVLSGKFTAFIPLITYGFTSP